jgi:hypothetical protein
MKKLIKLYQNKAVFLTDNNTIVVGKISADALKILDYYKKIPVNDFIA